MPALDILNITSNEGEADILERDINLLFAATGDPRNVIKTIVGTSGKLHGQVRLWS